MRDQWCKIKIIIFIIIIIIIIIIKIDKEENVHFDIFLNKTLKSKKNNSKFYCEVTEKVFIQKIYSIMGAWIPWWL